MLKSLSLLLVAFLVTQQCAVEASIPHRNPLDNNLQPNAFPTPLRSLGNEVYIIQAPPPTVKLEPGKRLVLTCEGLGKPLPSMQWMKNGEPVVDYEVDTNEVLHTHPSSMGLMISKLVVTAASNGDVFTCVVTSRGKEDNASTTVHTVGEYNGKMLRTRHKRFRLLSKPIITTYLKKIYQKIGTAIVLPCRVYSYTAPAHRIIWRDNKENVVFGNSRMQVLTSGDLLIKNLRWSDTGDFSCIAINRHETDIAQTFVFPLQI